MKRIPWVKLEASTIGAFVLLSFVTSIAAAWRAITSWL